mgnify:CR=1 FL=1
MKIDFAQIIYPVRYHIYTLTAYSLFVIGMNLLGNIHVNLWSLGLMISINIAVFYSLNGICSRFFNYENTIQLAMQLLTLILIWYAVVYALIYEVFPEIGRTFFGTGHEFHLGKYIRNITAYLEKSLLAVIIFQLAKLNKARNLALLAEKEIIIKKERQLNEIIERQLVLEREGVRIARENAQLRFTALSGQLKSHWLHNVTGKLRERISNGQNVTDLFDAYLDVLNYFYRHGGPDTNLVTLQDELHLVRLMKLLNEELNDGRKTLIVNVKEPLIARQLPPFTMTTLLENAFKFSDQSRPEYPILLVIESSPKLLAITCRNRVDISKVAASTKSGIGLHSIQQQLDYLVPGKHEIIITEEDNSFEITINIHY